MSHECIFNELSATPYTDRVKAKEGLDKLKDCLVRLDTFGIKNIKRSMLMNDMCLVGNSSFLRMLNDESLVDKDMKSVLINRMETLEPENELVNKHLTVSMTHENIDCKGLGWASYELENTFAISLHPEIWGDKHPVVITRLDDSAQEHSVDTFCRNITTEEHIEIHRKFLSSWQEIPQKGKILALILNTKFPNLIFSKQAIIQIKKLKSEEEITPIYARLQDLARVAINCSKHCAPEDFASKATPESESRLDTLKAKLTFSFENRADLICSWHLRFTPGAGRIYFYHDPSTKKICIGHIGSKIT